MRFAAPVTAANEVEALLRAGAGELYCGVLENAWRARYCRHDSISRRQGLANLTSRAELKALARECAAQDAPLFLALNSRYTPPMLPYLVELVADFEGMGGTGVHMSDIGLMAACSGMSGLTLSASLMGVTLNGETLAFYASLGIRRAVLPRCLSPEQMGEILRAAPLIEGEAMVMADKCPFVDGYCRAYHGVGYVDAPERELECGECGEILAFDTTYSSHLCTRLLGERSAAMPCAACALERLRANGVTIGKLGGRGLPLEERVKQLCFISAASRLEKTDDRRELYAECFGSNCCCYY